MVDINSYANDRLIEFLDAMHAELARVLRQKFGDDWLRLGVEKHLSPDYFARATEMLASPMRIIDMGKTDDELFGVEHLANIVVGNWSLFEPYLDNRNRTQVYLGEIAELRHNVSHRRQRHYLRRAELARFLQNARMLLSALGSSAAERFGAMAEGVSEGAAPWSAQLASSLPPHDEVVNDFVGRPHELRELSEWMATDSRQRVIWGYGGAGKSAIAYQFALDTKEAAPPGLQAVVWVSAKRLEYVDGVERERRSDFHDVPTFVRAIWSGLYGEGLSYDSLSADDLVQELSSTPALLVIDDLDSVLDEEELASFLLYELRNSRSKLLYTSRHRIPGIKNTDVEGFDGDELKRFIRTRAREHGLDQDECAEKAASIRSVTAGFRLFVDDLLRYARLARLYALRRQLEHLGDLARDVLIAIFIADRSLTILEIAQVSGRTDEDVEHALSDLLSWRLVNRAAGAQDARPGFDMNANTRRLVGKTYKGDARVAGYRTAFRSLSGEAMPTVQRHAIGSAINVARALVLRGEIEEAAVQLLQSMTGDLATAPDLHGALGWVYSRLPDKHGGEARAAFERSHALGSRKEDTYYQWAAMEREIGDRSLGTADDNAVLECWRRCAAITELGLARVGDTTVLCNMAGYARSREAKAHQRMNQFLDAQRCFGEALDYFKRGTAAPSSENRDVPRGVLFKGMAIACEGLEDVERLAAVLREWRETDPDDYHFVSERDRLTYKFPALGQLLSV